MFLRLKKEGPVERGGGGTKVGFNLNTISGIISGFKSRGFES
jgi:hypothetical protein